MRQTGPALRRFEKYDLLSIAFGLHAMAIVLTESAVDSVSVALLTVLMVAARVVLAALVQRHSRRYPLLLLRGMVTSLLTGAVMVTDGGTDSRFFLWLVLLLAWQAVISPLSDFRILAGFATVVYVVVAFASPGNVTGTAIGRFGLLAAFILVLGAGRILLEVYEARIRRLEHTVTAILSISAMAVVVYDSDRHTPLFANDAAVAIGLASHEGMARLIADGLIEHVKIDTLASLVEDAGWLPYEPRLFRVVGDPNRKLRVGIHALRLEDAEPVVLVYGEEVQERTSSPRQSP